jgi:hypothetical protein
VTVAGKEGGKILARAIPHVPLLPIHLVAKRHTGLAGMSRCVD